MTIINKKTVKYIIIAILFATAIFISIHFGIKLRQLKLDEMAEQIEKFGFYKTDLHVNIAREKKSLLYDFLTASPLLTVSLILIGNLIFDTFIKDKK